MLNVGTEFRKGILFVRLRGHLNKDTINKSVTTLYRYINNGYLTTTRMDLPYAVTYKKRKHNKNRRTIQYTRKCS